MDPAAGTMTSRPRAAGPEATRPSSEPAETTGADKVAYAFYAVAALAALVGQVWAGVKHIPWPNDGFPIALRVALVAPAVGVIELGGVATAALADVRRRKGENAYAYRAMSLAAAAVALTFNVVGHWTPEERFLAFGFGGLSAFAYVLWVVHSGARRRDALRANGHMAQTAPVYGFVRWLRDPRGTYRARQLALEHGYGLFDSVRRAKAELRTEGRNHAIEQVVAATIAAQHKDQPLHAQIAVTAYDISAVAAEISNVVNNPMMAHHIARVLEPPAHKVDPQHDHHPETAEAVAEVSGHTEDVTGRGSTEPDPAPPADEARGSLVTDLRAVLDALPKNGPQSTPEEVPDQELALGVPAHLTGHTDDQPEGPEDPEPPSTPGPGARSGQPSAGTNSPTADQPHREPALAGSGQGATPNAGPSGQTGQASDVPPPLDALSSNDQGLADTTTGSDTRKTGLDTPQPEHHEAPPSTAAEPRQEREPAAAHSTTPPAPDSAAEARRRASWWDTALPAMDAWADANEEVSAPRLGRDLKIPERTARRLVKKWEALQKERARRNNGGNVFPLSGQR